jgi:hypothetical protein
MLAANFFAWRQWSENEACSQDPANGSRSRLNFSHRPQEETLSVPLLSDCPFSIGRSLTSSVKMIRR